MKAASDFENAIRKAFAQALKDGCSPIICVGIVECVKGDVLTNIRQHAAEVAAEMQRRPAILRSTTLPPNGIPLPPQLPPGGQS